jgi:hypothetical protein
MFAIVSRLSPCLNVSLVSSPLFVVSVIASCKRVHTDEYTRIPCSAASHHSSVILSMGNAFFYGRCWVCDSPMMGLVVRVGPAIKEFSGYMEPVLSKGRGLDCVVGKSWMDGSVYNV